VNQRNAMAGEPERKKINFLVIIDGFINKGDDTMFKVTLTPSAAEELEELDNPIHARVIKLLVRLENWPSVSGAKKLSGDLAGRYRIRTGDYRVQFYVDGKNVIVEKIGHRDGFYEV
jgi:mRNA-degrading endonuclease RelE of RelBE toxin-antitoxin system